MPQNFNLPEDDLSSCMLADRPALRRLRHKIRDLQKAGQPAGALLARFTDALEQSRAAFGQRQARLPTPSFPEELPVSAKRAEIAAAIESHPVVIVCGETGSGKTTQLPKICLELKRGTAGLIGHTQPRRIAARTVASRIAHELRTPVGGVVGYKVRFTDKASPDNFIKLMTDGILLAETQGDRLLLAYDTLIIDEAHERSLNIDFLLGYLKQLLPRRPDLKIIITSATLDAERFSRHFGGAPVIEVSGRLYPVEMRYRPLAAREADEEGGLEQAILDAVAEATREGPGDILIFLPGEREIRDTAEALRKHHPPGAEILPLYARLSAAEQERIFRPGGGRRIVLATNVAETSLTVPGIRYVIDPGLARIKRYSYRNKVEQLRVEKISRSSANQRAGRCGRVASGICIRLYDEQDFLARSEFTEPEIRRSNLAAVILRMKALGLAGIESFPFVEPPDTRAVADGYTLLEELGAANEARELTAIGHDLARLPIDPRIGRMVLAAREHGCLHEMLVIAAALSVQDPRERPLDRQQAADQAYRAFQDENSDFLAYPSLWRAYDEALRHQKSKRKLSEWCREHFLSPARMREWREVYGQLHTLTAEMGWRENEVPAGYEEIHRALLCGLAGNVGVKAEDREYAGARGIKFVIHPASALKKKTPKWLVAAELTETGRLYARGVARIEPEWLERAAAHLLRRHYFDPHWEKTAGQVAAYERVTLYGLTVVQRRRIHYGPLDPSQAREIFIRSALIAGELNTKAPFLEHNRRLMAEVEELEHKSRRQDVLVDEDRMFAFFDARLPEGIHNSAAFEKWRRTAEKSDPHLLYLKREDLMRHGAESVTEELFPESAEVGGTPCRLSYRFEPGHPLDGVTLTVPLHLLNQLDAVRFGWLVPGMLREKTIWLIRALPKKIRAACVPLPEFVTAALMAIEPGRSPLPEALAAFILRKTGQPVPPDAWREADLPAHLRMNYRVVDEGGAELACGRDPEDLRAKLGEAARLTFSRAPELGLEREGVTAWDFGDLPEKIAFSRAGQTLTGYPALEDEGASVAIRLFDREEAARTAMRAGVRRLLCLSLREQMKQLEKSLPNFTQTALQFRAVASSDALKEDLLTALTDRAFIGDDTPPRTAAEFAAQKERARTRLSAVSEAANRLVAAIAAEYQAIQGRFSAKLPGSAAADLREQLARLVYPGFLSATPWEQLQHLPRYLKAILRRLDKLGGNLERDTKWTGVIRELWQNYARRLEKHRREGIRDAELDKFRWMLEELRVSLFAQELKTPYPVSVKRLHSQWEKVRP